MIQNHYLPLYVTLITYTGCSIKMTNKFLSELLLYNFVVMRRLMNITLSQIQFDLY